MDIGEILALITILLNLAGLVWGASKMDSATKNLTKVVDRIDKIVGDHEKRLSWIEGKLDV